MDCQLQSGQKLGATRRVGSLSKCAYRDNSKKVCANYAECA